MKKTIDERMRELEKALRALQLANNHYFETKDDAYLLLTQAQLRALLVSGPTMTPLLLGLSAAIGVPIEFYGLPAQPGPIKPNLLATVVSGVTWSPRPADRMVKTHLAAFLKDPFYFVPSTRDYRTREQVLKHISNKEGGAHYDEQLVAVVDTMRRAFASFKDPSGAEFVQTGIQLFLLDLSALVYWAGMRMGYVWNDRTKGLDETKDERITRIDAQFVGHSASNPYLILEMLG
jgi:hypothetical protein